MSSSFEYCPKCAGHLGEINVEGIERLICTQCGNIFYENPKPTASALLVERDSVLLVKRAIEPRKGFWDLPGGFLEKDEHPEQALRREIKEELGVEIDILELLGIYTGVYGYDDSGGHTLNIYYLGRVSSGEPRAASDIEDLRWFDKDELPLEIAFENNKKALETWLHR